MAEVKKPKVGKEAAANDLPDETERADAKGHDILIDNACFDAERLVGDVGDFLLKDLRTTHELKSWSKMSEKQQNALIDRCDKQARAIVAATMRGIASRGIEHMEGILDDKGSFGDGFFKLSVKVPMNPHNMALLAKHDGEVQVVFSSPQKFQSTMMVRSEPDAPPLPGVVKPDEAAAATADTSADAETGKDKKKKDKPEEAAPAASPSA